MFSMDSMADRMLFLLKKTGKIKGGRGGGDDEVPKMMKVVHRLDQDVSGENILIQSKPGE